MTLVRPGGTPQQEHILSELEHARSAELDRRVAQGEAIAEANAATRQAPLPTRVRHAIARRLRRG